MDEIGLVVYEEMSFKDGRTPEGRRTKSDHKSSPCHFVTGELKTGREVMYISEICCTYLKYVTRGTEFI